MFSLVMMRRAVLLAVFALFVAGSGGSSQTPEGPTGPDDATREAQRAEDARFENWRNVWVSGAWRIPPSEEHDWEPSRWIRAEGGVRLIPGGSRIEIRPR